MAPLSRGPGADAAVVGMVGGAGTADALSVGPAGAVEPLPAASAPPAAGVSGAGGAQPGTTASPAPGLVVVVGSASLGAARLLTAGGEGSAAGPVVDPAVLRVNGLISAPLGRRGRPTLQSRLVLGDQVRRAHLDERR
jgi:hypothetical protein